MNENGRYSMVEGEGILKIKGLNET